MLVFIYVNDSNELVYLN